MLIDKNTVNCKLDKIFQFIQLELLRCATESHAVDQLFYL